MAYATVAEVQNYFQNATFGTSDPISSTKVQFMLDSWEAMINMRLSLVCATPVTDSVISKVVKEVQVKFVANDIDNILRDRGNSVGKSNSVEKTRDLGKEANEKLNTLFEYLKTVRDEARNLVSYNNASDAVPVFKRSTEY